jgi:soluble lytic murein transglycosylase-like protein
MSFENACGGLRWEMQDDGLIAVEGQGTPYFAPGSIQFVQLTQTWNNWGGKILDASSRTGVPASWILAIATEETGLWSANPSEQASKISGAGAIGLMQIMPATAKGFGANPDDMFDPSANIAVGAALLAKLADARVGQLPEMAAAYNSGRVCDPGRNQWNLAMAGDYAGSVVKWNNSAVMYLDLRPRMGKLLFGLALGGAGLYTAAIIAGLTVKPKWLRV